MERAGDPESFHYKIYWNIFTLLCSVYGKLQPATKPSSLYVLVNKVLSEYTPASFIYCSLSLLLWQRHSWVFLADTLSILFPGLFSRACDQSSLSLRVHTQKGLHLSLILCNHGLEILKNFVFELVFCGVRWSVREGQGGDLTGRLAVLHCIWQVTRQGLLTHPTQVWRTYSLGFEISGGHLSHQLEQRVSG